MRRILTSVIFLFSLYASFSQADQSDRIKLSGKIIDNSQKPVSYAHILELSRNEGWVSDYFGEFHADVMAGDTLVVSAISFHHTKIYIPGDLTENDYMVEVILQPDTVQLKELVIHPWPATYSQLKNQFMQVEIEDPLANLDLHLPSPEELKMLSYSLEGGFGIRAPVISMIYDQFSREARNKRNYEVAMKAEKANSRYNKIVISRVTGLTKDEDIQRFMQFCALQVKFILESTDYELYAAILNCYNEFCEAGLLDQGAGH